MMFTEWVEGGKTSSICGRVKTPMASVDKTKTKIKKFSRVSGLISCWSSWQFEFLRH